MHHTARAQVDIDKIEDPLKRQATIEQIRSFGQTPRMLFRKPHPPRLVLSRTGCVFASPGQLAQSHLVEMEYPVGMLSCTSNGGLVALPPYHCIR